jgi:AbiA family abortive infection protein
LPYAPNKTVFAQIPVMTNSNTTQLGYFIEYSLWQEALKLLNFQIEQKKNNRHFYTLSMFYYEKIDANCLKNLDCTKEYFDVKIASSLFYGLKKEFCVFSYVIPKPGLGLRNYIFFTYPMRAVYYTVGLYLLKISQDFLSESYKKVKRIESFYGGNLSYKSEKLQLTPKNIYYRSFYKEFQSKIREETQSCNQEKVVLHLDIENYFNELSISRLLDLLSQFLKPSIQRNMRYDLLTREKIISLFQFISGGKSGIPQSDNDIISDFIGYLYLAFGDLFIDNILVDRNTEIESHKIIRYVDDIYIFVTFKKHINEEDRGSLIHLIASQIAEILYSRLSLKLNLKTKLYRLSKEKEKKELLKNIKKSSLSHEFFSTSQDDDEGEEKKVKTTTEKPQDKLNQIFIELENIKKSRVEDYFIKGNSAQKEILQEVFDKRVEQILDKPENKNKIEQIFKEFKFDLVKVQPLEILIILLKNEEAANSFKSFCLNKKIVTIGDADLIIKFLCQTSFQDTNLLHKLKQNNNFRKIIDVFLDEKLNCDQPGYYNLTCLQMKKLSDMPDMLEQTRLRILSERSTSYSVALNHLVNEIHAICIEQIKAACEEKDKKKNYDVNDVVKFLRSKGIPHEICIKIRNLFDRRNSNSVSHPGSDGSIAWGVTKEEYLDYYEQVGQCLDFLL